MLSLFFLHFFIVTYSHVFSQPSLEIEWATIPSGPFLFGSNSDTATIDYQYSISKTELTNGQYLRFLNSALEENKITIKGNRVIGYYGGDGIRKRGNYTYLYFKDNSEYEDIFKYNGKKFSITDSSFWYNHPVRFITWFGANAFVEYYILGLPTSEEWEKAARGLINTAYPWGVVLHGKFANYHNSGDPFDNGTIPVKYFDGSIKTGFVTEKNFNTYGVYDMIGNVSEWTESFSEFYPEYRIFRGGSWRNESDDLIIYQLREGGPELATSYLGFRCVKRD